MKPRPDPKQLSELLEYDPQSGVIRRRRDGAELGHLHPRGYRRICVGGRTLPAHHIAWALFYGEWPASDAEIDHVNRNRADNRIKNLRLASKSENKANRIAFGKYPKGVRLMYKSGTFFASICTNYTKQYLGSFQTVDEAAHAYNKAAIKAFGEFARLNPVGVE